MYQNEKGLSVISLILIVIIIIAIICIGVYFGRDVLEKDNLESIKTDMMQIEGRAIPMANDYSMDEESTILLGIKINRVGNDYEAAGGEYALPEELQKVLREYDIEKVEETEESKEEKASPEEAPEGEAEEKQAALYYIWTQKDLEKIGLGSIKVDNVHFYIVNYRGPKIFYSVGYEGIYELESLKDKYQ